MSVRNFVINTVGGTGRQGRAGGRGTQGFIGQMGSQGVAGMSGSGVQGFAGQDGRQGEMGIGVQGFAGQDGRQGEMGIGVQGFAGQDGRQGEIGIGVQGFAGQDGRQGEIGIGVQGFAGQDGRQGQGGVQGPAGLGTQGSGLVPVNNTVFVDAQFGNDVTGTRENQVMPFAGINAALTAALVGDVIYVRPGSYTENITLRDGIDFYFQLGSQVSAVIGGSTSGYVFSDVSGPVTVRIRGDGVFEAGHGGASGGILDMAQASSSIDFQAFRASVTGTTVGSTLRISAGTVMGDIVQLTNDSIAAGGAVVEVRENTGTSLTVQTMSATVLSQAALLIAPVIDGSISFRAQIQRLQAINGTALMVNGNPGATSIIDVNAQTVQAGEDAIVINAAATQGTVNFTGESFVGGINNSAGSTDLKLNLAVRSFVGSGSLRALGGVTDLRFEEALTTGTSSFLTTTPAPGPAPILTGTIGLLSPGGQSFVVIDVTGAGILVDLRIDEFEYDIVPPDYAVVVRDGATLSLDILTMRARNPLTVLSNGILVTGSQSLLKSRIVNLSCPGQALDIDQGGRATCSFQMVRRDSSGAAVGPTLPMVRLTGNSIGILEAQEMFSVPQLASSSSVIENSGGILIVTGMGYLRAPASDDTSSLIRLGGTAGPPFQFAATIGKFQVIEAEQTGPGVSSLIHQTTLSFLAARIELMQGGRAILMENVQCQANLSVNQISNGSPTGPSVYVRDAASLKIELGFLSCQGAAVLAENNTAVGNTSNVNMIFENITAGNAGGPPSVPAVCSRGLLGGFAALRLLGGGISGGNANDYSLLIDGDSYVDADINSLTSENTPLAILGNGVARGRFGQILTFHAPAIYMASTGDSYITANQILAQGPGTLPGLTPQSTVLVRNPVPPPLLDSGNLNLQALLVGAESGVEYAIRLEGASVLSANLNNINSQFGGTTAISLIDSSTLQMRLGYVATLDSYVLDCRSTGGVSLQFLSMDTGTKFGCVYANAGNILLEGIRMESNSSSSAIFLEDQIADTVFPNLTFRIEEIRGISRVDGPGPLIQMNSAGTLDGRFNSMVAVNLNNGATTAALTATKGITYLEGILTDVRNADQNTARGFIVTGTANAEIYVKHVISQYPALEGSTSGQVWWIVEHAETTDVTFPVVRLTPPAPGSGSYTVGGHLRSPSTQVIFVNSFNPPSLLRLSNSTLVNNGLPATFTIDSLTPVNLICRHSIANSPENAIVTLVPAGLLAVDPGVQ